MTFIRRIARQTIILAALTGLMFAAGADWAHAAPREAGHTMPSELHVVVLFLATIAFVIGAVVRSQKPVRIRARRRNRR